jgi:hypothetical protein
LNPISASGFWEGHEFQRLRKNSNFRNKREGHEFTRAAKSSDSGRALAPAVRFMPPKRVFGNLFSRAIKPDFGNPILGTRFWEGHDFNRAVTVAKSARLQPLRSASARQTTFPQPLTGTVRFNKPEN